MEGALTNSHLTISKSSSVPRRLIVRLLIVALRIIADFALFIVGGVTVVSTRGSSFIIYIGVGTGLFLFGMIFCVVSLCVVQLKAQPRLHKAIAEESARYSSHSPTPCSWRLFSTREYTNAYHNDHQGTRMVQHVRVLSMGLCLASSESSSCNW